MGSPDLRVEETRMADTHVSVHLEGPYWLTRDKRNGVLLDKIEVWLAKPALHRFEDGDIMWLPDLLESDSHYGEWTINQCLKECRVYPETERECIVVGYGER